MSRNLRLIAVLIALILLSACSSAATTVATTVAPPTNAPAQTTAGATTGTPGVTTAGSAAKPTTTEAKPTTTAAKEPPGEFTMFYQEAGQNFPQGFDHGNNDFLKIISEWANVKITKVIVPSYTDTMTRFNLMMSGNDIPDLIERADVATMKDYGAQGAFMPTEEIIRNSPVMSKVYNDTQIQAMKSEDGKAYIIVIPPLNDDFNTLYVRKDLLDEQGLEIPTTIGGMTEAARQLKQKYPDSLPFGGPGLAWRTSWMVTPFNTQFSGWKYNFTTGKVENCYEGENIVKSVTWVKQLYDEGLLDKEFITTNSDSDNQKRVTRKQLFSFANCGSEALWIQRYTAANEKQAQYVPMITPVAPDVGVSEIQMAPSVIGSYAFGINAQTKSKDAILRFLEVLYSDQVNILTLYGREGIEYKLEGGKKVAIQPASNDSLWRSIYGWVFVNNKERLLQQRANAVTAILGLDDAKKKEYLDILTSQDTKIRESMYGKLPYSPFALAKPIEEVLRNQVREASQEQLSLYSKTVLGEITVDQFKTEKDKLVEKYKAITEAYQVVTDEAKKAFNLK